MVLTAASLAGVLLFAQLGSTVLAGITGRKFLEDAHPSGKPAERLRKAINWFVLNISMPALVFQTMHGAPLGADIIQAPIAAIAGMAITGLIAWAVLARLYGKTPETGGLVLAACAGSVSFFGIPLARSLFGPEEARIAVYFAVLNIPLSLLAGALISGRIGRHDENQAAGAARGAVPGRFAIARQAARQVLILPANWALVAGFASRAIPLPDGVSAALHLLAGTVGPTTMFALGLGLRLEPALASYRMALPAVAIKLMVSPLVVLGCAAAVGLTGVPLAIVAIQGAMPTQVLSVVVAERYRLNSRLVGLTLALDTLLAFVLLPLLLGRLGIGGSA